MRAGALGQGLAGASCQPRKAIVSQGRAGFTTSGDCCRQVEGVPAEAAAALAVRLADRRRRRRAVLRLVPCEDP